MEKLNGFYERFPGSYIAYIGFIFSVAFMSIAIVLYNDPNFTIFTHYIYKGFSFSLEYKYDINSPY